MSLKIGVIGTPPGVMPCALSPRCSDRGFAYDAALTVCRRLNFNCTFTWYEGSGGYGDAVDGNGTGLVGAIQRREFDTSVPVFTPTYTRFQAITFSDIYFYFDVIFATRAPGAKTHLFNWGVIYSFNWRTWLVFISALVLTSFVISAASRFCTEANRRMAINPWTVLVNTFASLISMKGNRYEKKQKTSNFLNTGFTQTLLVLWTFVGLVLTSAYTGMLFSQKVASARELPFVDFETFVQCLENTKCRIIAHTTSNSAIQLLTAPGSYSTDRVQKALNATPIKILPLEMIPNAIMQEKNVHLVWVWSESAILYAIKGNANCAFYTISAPYKEVYTFPLRKSSPLLSKFNKAAAPFWEQDLAYAIRARYPGSAMCMDQWDSVRPSESGLNEGNLASMFTIFLFWLLGSSAGILAFAFEKRPKIWLRHKKSNVFIKASQKSERTGVLFL